LKGDLASYVLMHKNFPVVAIQISRVSGYIEKIVDVYCPERMPLGTEVGDRYGNIHRNIDYLNRWWLSRSIPASRQGIQAVLDKLKLPSSTLLIEKCYGLSLSDHYWIKPSGAHIKWEDINFFQNEFTQDMGEILFGQPISRNQSLNLLSPDNTSDGWLKKKWVISQGKPYLIKGGSGVFKQEPFNEVIASALYSRLGIDHVPYHVIKEKGEFYSVCENFLAEDTEFIPAWHVIKAFPKQNHVSGFEHLLKSSEILGIPNPRQHLNRMLATDFILANSDRHVGNFGFIRNVETLEWQGMAPIFDSGTSLWNNTLEVGKTERSRPFKESPYKQIGLINDLTWFNGLKLADFSSVMTSILKGSPTVDEVRQEKLVQEVSKRIEYIKNQYL